MKNSALKFGMLALAFAMTAGVSVHAKADDISQNNGSWFFDCRFMGSSDKGVKGGTGSCEVLATTCVYAVPGLQALEDSNTSPSTVCTPKMEVICDNEVIFRGDVTQESRDSNQLLIGKRHDDDRVTLKYPDSHPSGTSFVVSAFLRVDDSRLDGYCSVTEKSYLK